MTNEWGIPNWFEESAYGMLPPGFMAVLRKRLAQRRREKLAVTTQTE